MPILLLLYILFGIAAGFEQCPKQCKCAPDPIQPTTRLLMCDIPIGASALPIAHGYSVPSNIRTVFITCRGPTSFPHDLFHRLTGLHHLKIEGCGISQLPTKLFDDLAALRKLEIERIPTAIELTDDLLTPLTRLEKFSVTYSPNVELPSRLLCHLPHLQVLNLSANAIPTLRRDEPCVAQQLLIVDLSRNRLETIEQFLRGVPAIRELSVAHNQLSTIAIGAETPFIQHLEAENNRLIEMSGKLPDTLVHVNIASNSFTEIPEAIFALPNLVSLNISANRVAYDASGNSTAFQSKELESLDLSRNQLTVVPTEWLENCEHSVAHLHFERNLIDGIARGSFANATNLQTLDLSGNKIREFAAQIFPASPILTSLNLGDNALERLASDSLSGLKLDTLDLSTNRFVEVPSAIGDVVKLKNVDLSRNRIAKLAANTFSKIADLHHIDLSHNQLQSVTANVFSSSANLHTLDLSNNRISLIFKDSFAQCPKLKKIILRENAMNSLDEGLLEATSLRKLDISGNSIVVLKWASFPESLETIVADRNQINLLTASSRSKIKTVSLRENRLNMLTSEQIPDSVETFDAASNRIAHLAKGALAHKSQLRKIDLSDNELEIVELDAVRVVEAVHPVEVLLAGNPLECSCQMTWLLQDYQSNSAKSTYVAVKDHANATCRHAVDGRTISLRNLKKDDMLCRYSQVCEPECICCQYGNCDCKSVCPASCRCFRDESFDVNIVRCERNETLLPKREFVVSELPVSATEIMLSGVVLPQLRTHSFIGRLRLQKLHINGTGLRSIQPKAFHTLPALQTLDLSGNSLHSLSGDEFLKTPQILQLFLNGNRFTTLSRGVFEKLPNLKFLTLHNNSFEDIPAALSNLPAIRQISLSANPLRCDCAAQQTRFRLSNDGFAPPMIEHNAVEWMFHNRHLVVDAPKVECVENVTRAFITNDTTILSARPPNVNGDIFVMQMDEFLQNYNVSICVQISSGFFGHEPQNSIIFIVLAVSCSLLLCIFVIIGVSMVRRSHDAINQRRYKASSLNCSTSAGSSPLPMPLLSYHAFVSYSKKDEKMVIDQLCRPLEDDDYQLCLLHRDGPTYNSNLHAISDELIAQMEASQCLILVLTRHFLDNEWKTLQIKTSHQLFAKNRAKRVIAVLGDGVDANLLDDELGQILRKHTRIDMSSHLFWTLLHSSLPSRMPLHHSTSAHDDSSQVYSDIYGIVPSDVV
ncbi:unnamed protein product [Caenorhabditis bovis]|uniref:TIR domain-containing protein n=1 Tax=Caenorhabditis bovis TaxID=2654633 RepID=A0A8S1FCS2_9PELO|nr:unnamed protein product [Caenorhabditis bovis]